MGWTYGVMGETQITASRANVSYGVGTCSFDMRYDFLDGLDE